jgi:hypothetical protein
VEYLCCNSFSTVASETGGNCGNYRTSCPPGTYYAKDGGENHELFFPVAEEEEEEDTGGNCSNCGNNKWVLQ